MSHLTTNHTHTHTPHPQPTREVVRPANQLQLSEAELREEVAKMLTANNPAAPQNLARFNMKERSYKFEPMVEQHVSVCVCVGAVCLVFDAFWPRPCSGPRGDATYQSFASADT